MEARDGDADARKKRKGIPTAAAAPPSLAPPPSVRMGPGDGGAPTAKRRRKPTGAAASPSLGKLRLSTSESSPPAPTPPPEDVAAPGGHATAPPPSLGELRRQVRRRKSESGPPAPTPPPEDVGAPGGHATEGSGPPAPTPPQEDVASPGGHVAEGSGPPAPTPPPEDVAAPGRISVAHTPNIPPRFEGLLKNITSLIPYGIKGKSYECAFSRMNAFLRWSRSELALFFEWDDSEEQATCWMHDILKKKHFKFTVNAAFPHKMDNINVERAAVAFSKNFVGGDEYWSDLKDMLFNMFGSFEGETLKEYDYLFVFTRVGDLVYFRNFKINNLPKAHENPSTRLVLTEINTMFCLKLVNDQGNPSSSNTAPHLPNDQTSTESTLPLTLYGISNGQTGFSSSHEVDFNGQTYSVSLDNGSYVSSFHDLDGFNISLAEIVVKKPLLKIKHIIGSATDKTHCFARERCKSILQSLFVEFAMLLESGKCVSRTGQVLMHNVLVRGANVRLYGLDLIDYTEALAKRTVEQLVEMVRKCFPSGTIPEDLCELLKDLEKNPLEEIRIAEEDCSVLKAADRRMLLIDTNSEYMTNVEAAKSSEADDEIDERINDMTFFDDCPYMKEWKGIMKDNEYMVQICNVGKSAEEKKGTDEGKNAAVVQRMDKKEKMSENTRSIKKFAEKKKLVDNEGMLQFSSKRNFHMHMPERARKDGIIPFRLGMADHILTAYFPLFLRFVQKRMREVKAQSGKFKKSKRRGYVVRGRRQ